MKIAIGCDAAGATLKPLILEYLKGSNIEYEDFGIFGTESAPQDYTDYAVKVAKRVSLGECERGILLCGTGIGMAIVANKFKGVRAAVCHDEFTARATSAHNDSNILCMGGRVIAPYQAPLLLDAWLNTPFEGGRHKIRVDKITELEK